MGSVRQNAPRQGLRSSPGLRRRGQRHVVSTLLGRAALVNGRQGQTACQAGGCGAAIHPAQLEGRQSQRQVFGSGDESALLRLHEGGGDPGVVEGLEQLGLGRGPLMGVAIAGGHQARHGSAGHGAGRLDEHLQVEAVGESPLNLAHRVTRESEHGFCPGIRDCAH